MRTLTQWAPIAVLILTWTLAGCDRQAQIATGIYVVQGAAKQSRAPYNESDHEFEQASAPELASIFLDRENTSVWIRHADGSLVVAGFTARQEAAWSLGCPTNTGSTRMEVVDIGRDSLAIGSATIRNPFLVRDCSPEPVMLALRGEGEINGAGAACTGTPTCVLLTWATEAYNLPRSMKGYELYSWRTATEGVWTYTLVTGTNRNKTWDEIGTPESMLTVDDWVKITVSGVRAIQSALGRLPDGEEVFWIGPGDPQATSTLGYRIELPDAETVRALTTYARDEGLHLTVGD